MGWGEKFTVKIGPRPPQTPTPEFFHTPQGKFLFPAPSIDNTRTDRQASREAAPQYQSLRPERIQATLMGDPLAS